MSEIRNSGSPPRVSGAEYIRDNSQKKLIITEEDKKEKKEGSSPESRQRHPHGQIDDDVEVHQENLEPRLEIGQQFTGQLIPDPTHQLMIFVVDDLAFIVQGLEFDELIRFVEITLASVEPTIEGLITSVDGQELESALKVTLIKPEKKRKDASHKPSAPDQQEKHTTSYANLIAQAARERDDRNYDQDVIRLGAVNALGAPQVKPPQQQAPIKTQPDILKGFPAATSEKNTTSIMQEDTPIRKSQSAEGIMPSHYHDDCESIKEARILYEECDPMHFKFFETIAPGAAKGFPDSLALILAAFIAENETVWIGPKSLAAIEQKYQAHSAATLHDQFQNARRRLLGNLEEKWTKTELILHKNQTLNPIKILKKRDENGSLTIVRMTLSLFGQLQLEIKRTPNTIDAVFRGSIPLPKDFQNEVEDLLSLLAKRSGLTGNLAFGLINESAYSFDDILGSLKRDKPSSFVT